MAGRSFSPHEPLAARQAAGGSDRSFGLTFAAVFAIVAVLPLFHHGHLRWWALAVSGCFAVAALARPALLAPGNRLWSRFGEALHAITNPLLLGLVFYLAITPTALIFRMLGRNLLDLKADPDIGSYWIDRKPPGPDPKTMVQPF